MASLSWQITPIVRSCVEHWIGNNEASLPKSAAGDFFQLPPDEQKSMIARLTPEDLPEKKPLLEALLNGAGTREDVRATSFRAAMRLRLGIDPEWAEKWTRHSDANLASAALEYMSWRDPDRVVPLLGKFLQMSNPRMKSAALCILKRFDPNQAISTIQALLSSRDSQQQSLAIACMVHFDFPLVRNLLTTFLLANTDRSLLENGLNLFEANPDPENLFPLYVLEKSLPGELGGFPANVRKSLRAFLLEAGFASQEAISKLEAGFSERQIREQERKAAPRPAYAYRSVPVSLEEPWNFQRILQSSRFRWGVLLALILVNGVVFLGFSPGVEKKVGKRIGHPILSASVSLTGVVEMVDSANDRVVLRTDDGGQFLFNPQQDGCRVPALKSRIRAMVVPYRKNQDGVIFCRLQTLEIQEGKIIIDH